MAAPHSKPILQA
jgi:hypothetical protein